jgi:type IV pilus assembly protein PilZ
MRVNWSYHTRVTASEERRESIRVPVSWEVDCGTEDTFLYACIANISELGIFVRTTEPLEAGTPLTLHFRAPGENETSPLNGIVQWVNPVRPFSRNRNPGMGIRFVDLTREQRKRLVHLVRTMAYVREHAN